MINVSSSIQCGARRFRLRSDICRASSLISHAKKQQAKQRKGKRGRGDGRLLDEDGDGAFEADDVLMDSWMGSNAVKAPSIGPNPKRTSIAGDDDASSSSEYQVFAPKPSNLSELNAPWAWDETVPSEPATPAWNPISGFSRPPEEGLTSTTSRPNLNPLILFSSSTTTQSDSKAIETSPTPPRSPSEALPSVMRDQVLTSCVSTSVAMTGLAWIIRHIASNGTTSSFLHTDPVTVNQLLDLSPINLSLDVAVALGSALLVTGARFILLQTWPEFSSASMRSNEQILTPLSWIDITLVALLTGCSEEALFRSALIPASYPDWKGAVLSGIIFGLLHNSGGRNLSFALWASGVGVFYGALFLTTHDIWVPVAAHSTANLLSAVIFKQNQTKTSKSN